MCIVHADMCLARYTIKVKVTQRWPSPPPGAFYWLVRASQN